MSVVLIFIELISWCPQGKKYNCMPTYSIILGIDRIVNFVSFNLKIKGLHSSRHWAYRKFEEYKRFLRGAQDITTSKRSLFSTCQTPEGLHTRMKNSWHINLFFTFSKWKLKFYLKENFICYAPVLTTHQHAQWHMKHIYSIEFDCTNLLAMGWKVLTIHIF